MLYGTSTRRKGKSTTSKMNSVNSGLASLIDMFADQFVINGCTYCRPHLKISCHLCEVDYGHLNDEADEERARLGLRPVGDPALNCASEFMQQRAWGGVQKELQGKEIELNQRFLQRARSAPTASASPAPPTPLLKCTKFKVVKHCCKENQLAD